MSFDSRFSPSFVRDNGFMTMGTNGILTLNGVPIITTYSNLSNTLISSNISVGFNSLISFSGTGANNLVLGNNNAASTFQGLSSIFIGYGNGSSNILASGQTNVGIGYQTLTGMTSSAVANNIAIGNGAGASITTGSDNIAIGQSSVGATTGSHNVAIGNTAGTGTGAGTYNVSLGYTGAMYSSYNIGIGTYCFYNSQNSPGTPGLGNIAIGGGQYTGPLAQASGSGNIAIGYCGTGYSTASGTGGNIYSGNSNIAIGNQAMGGGSSQQISGAGNIAIGYSAGSGLTSTAANNTLCGYNNGTSITTGKYNSVLGANVASSTLTTGSYNILLGCTSGVTTPSSSTSNYLAIGLAMDGTTGENSNTANAGIRSLGYVAEKNYQIVNASSATVSNASSSVIITGQATCTITTPASPVDGQLMKISCDGTAVATFTLTANSGQTVLGAPVALTANTGIGYIYRLSNTTWYRQY